MDTPSPTRSSWLAGLLLVLGLIVLATLVRGVWQVASDPPERVSDWNVDETPERVTYSLDEALEILARPRNSVPDEIAAIAAIRDAGKTALPGLLRLLDHSDTEVAGRAIHYLDDIGMPPEAHDRLKALCDAPQPQIRLDALTAAWKLGCDRESLRPQILRALSSPNWALFEAAARLAASLDPPSVEELFAVLDTDLAHESWTVVPGLLVGLAERDESLLCRLLKLRATKFGLRGSLFNRPILVSTLKRLARSQPDPEIRLQALLSAVGVPWANSRGGVVSEAECIESMRPHLKDLFAAAETYRDSPGSEELADVLWWARGEGVPGLEILLKSSLPSTRYEAAYWLAVIDGSRAADLLPIFREAMRSAEPMHRYHGVCSVGHLGNAGTPAIPELKSLAQMPDNIGIEAKRILDKLGVHVEVAEPAP